VYGYDGCGQTHVDVKAYEEQVVDAVSCIAVLFVQVSRSQTTRYVEYQRRNPERGETEFRVPSAGVSVVLDPTDEPGVDGVDGVDENDELEDDESETGVESEEMPHLTGIFIPR